ncbi:hypothetical protein PCLA_04f0433 [Pseudomonas citronellolis]|uniref:hypothetical protein n=1 Tax=Pseudomonas citronellolis TaxID=53408 RepID=UPI000ED7933B|nr:hypothetical protein [Pseudomonas citronellolis]GBL55844.1 hypothetical protein PCLA_04f0433 [Pseudomonas citronellolis]
MNTKELLAEHERLQADVNAKVQALDDFVSSADENDPAFTLRLQELQSQLEVAVQQWKAFSSPSSFWSSWFGRLIRKLVQ